VDSTNQNQKHDLLCEFMEDKFANDAAAAISTSMFDLDNSLHKIDIDAASAIISDIDHDGNASYLHDDDDDDDGADDDADDDDDDDEQHRHYYNESAISRFATSWTLP
jgi:hypothetical protein